MSHPYTRAAVRSSLRELDAVRDRIASIEPDTRWNQLCREVDPAGAIRDLMSERLTGPAAEANAELQKRRHPDSSNSVRIPWETLAYRSARYNATRADIAGVSSLGGFLVPTMNFASAAQALMSMMVLGRLGITAIDGNGANLNLPKETASASPFWLSTETTQVTESDLQYGQTQFSPHTVGGYTEMSRLLILQSSPSAGDVVANNLSRKLAREIQAQALVGDGTGGVIHGLLGMTGVNVVSGANYALSTACNAATDTGDALEDDNNPGWAVNRSVASLLRQRPEVTNSTSNSISSKTLWRGPLTWGALADWPAGSTSGVPAGTAFFGNWSYLFLVDFAGGVEIAVNPFGQPSASPPYSPNFQAGIVGMRALATIDVSAVFPSAFTVVNNIT